MGLGCARSSQTCVRDGGLCLRLRRAHGLCDGGVRLLTQATAIKNMAAAVEGLAAARVAEGGQWRREGFLSLGPLTHIRCR